MSGPEIIDVSSLGDDNIEEVRFGNNRSSSFGAGIELLMNDKKKSSSSGGGGLSSDIDINDLDNLEDELNDLSGPKKSMKSARSDMFSGSFKLNDENDDDDDDDDIHNTDSFIPLESLNLGKSTKEQSDDDAKTWDGYGKFNNVPINPDVSKSRIEPQLSKEEQLKEKFTYLQKLEALEKKGVNLTKKYDMESNLLEMKGEYETVVAEKERKNSMKFQGKMMMACITGLEFLNNKFDPFDVKLDGWSEQINENIDDYDDIFAELHEKYKSKATMAPELKLLFQLGGSALMVHMTNSMFKSSMPGMDDIMRQNPELMKQFTQAAVNTMGQQQPGFGNFMNDVMGGRQDDPTIIQRGPPPPPVSTKKERTLNANPNMKNISVSQMNMNAGVSVNDQFSKTHSQPLKSKNRNKRQEMKGPSDIDNILSRLKSKKVDMKKNKPNSSTISVEDLKEMSNVKMPRKSSKKRSSRNTISLDI